MTNAKQRIVMVPLMLLVVVACAGWTWGPVGQKVEELERYIYGMQSYVYGFPLVMMDMTREVLKAAPSSGQYSAPINQFARMRTVVSPDFKNVVRISVNSLWTDGFLDLQ